MIECKEAHEAPVLRLAPLYKGCFCFQRQTRQYRVNLSHPFHSSKLASCSADSSIKVWEIPTGARTKSQSNARRKQKLPPMQPRSVVCSSEDLTSSLKSNHFRQGDMLGHSGAVHDLLVLNENSVASCGADHLVRTTRLAFPTISNSCFHPGNFMERRPGAVRTSQSGSVSLDGPVQVCLAAHHCSPIYAYVSHQC